MYPGNCPDPYGSVTEATGTAISLGGSTGTAVMRGPDGKVENTKAAFVDKQGTTDSTFGTGDNPDTCQKELSKVPVVYTDKCPGGGVPNPKFAQCGGTDWDGSTCCFGYSVCEEVPTLS
jgi:hypothetical protein